jgi:hypothetical protein
MPCVDRSSRARSEFHRWGIAVLLTVVLALAVIGAWQPLHLHHSDTAGLFNEEHVLAALDSVTGEIPLSGHVPAVWLDLARTKARLPNGAWPDAAVTRHADSRAPPRA